MCGADTTIGATTTRIDQHDCMCILCIYKYVKKKCKFFQEKKKKERKERERERLVNG